MGMVSKGMAACTSLSMNGHGVVQPGRCLSGGVVMNEATGRPFEHLGSELAVAGPSWRCALIVGIRALGVERGVAAGRDDECDRRGCRADVSDVDPAVPCR